MRDALSKIRHAQAAVGVARFRLMGASLAMAIVLVNEAQAASTTLGDAAAKILEQLGNVGKVSIAGAFLCGIYMLAGGLFKLKQASESQGQQTPYSAGMWRLVLGGGLCALPALAGMITQSAGLDPVQMNPTVIF